MFLHHVEKTIDQRLEEGHGSIASINASNQIRLKEILDQIRPERHEREMHRGDLNIYVLLCIMHKKNQNKCMCHVFKD